MFERVRNGYRKVCLVGMVATGICLVVMMAYGFASVSLRYLFDFPLHGAFELTELLMVVVVFMAIAGTQVYRRHMRADFLLAYVSQKVNALLDSIAYLFGMAVCGLLVWLSIDLALLSWSVREETWGLVPFPVYPAKFIVVLGSFMLFVQLLLELVGSVRNYLAVR